MPVQSNYKIVLENGLNDVIYENSNTTVPNYAIIYYNNEELGTLTEIKSKSSNSNINNKLGQLIGTVDTLKNALITTTPPPPPPPLLSNGGKINVRRNIKSKKARKSRKAKKARKSKKFKK
jgi:hypothetical protein